MAFRDAHDFYIHQLNAVDGQSKELKQLLDAACPGAGHRSAERGDAPKCHPETRKAVLNDIMSWVDSTDLNKPLMWLSGPAGAGKTCISQTVCDRCDAEQKLLASFFFSRSVVGTGRNDGNRLVPTIAIQLAISNPETKGYIIGKLENNPLLLTYSMEDQLQQLVLDPIATALATQSKKAKMPYLVVIDGLDECDNRSMQARIISAFAAIGSKMNIHLRYLIVSRPELEIRNTFDAVTTSDTCTRIVLDAHYKPDDDIRVYLQSEFSMLKRNHTLKSDLSQALNWPTSKEVEWLVEKSSGQFIYASTIIKYLEDPRRDPRASLSAITDHKIIEKSHNKKCAYSALDALYQFILKSAALNLGKKFGTLITIFQVLLYKTSPRNTIPYVILDTKMDVLEYFAVQISWSLAHLGFLLSTKISELELLLSDLHSLISIPKSDSTFNHMEIKFYHASISDFFKDPSRSGQFFIDEKTAHKSLAQLCFRVISSNPPEQYDYPGSDVIMYCYDNQLIHIKKGGYFPLAYYFFLIRVKLIRGFRWNDWHRK